MSEGFIVIEGSKEEKYLSLLAQLPHIIGPERDMIANMANASSILKGQFGWHWVGFYIAKEEELVLGPFQGPVACTRISKGKGVCGSAWQAGESIVVKDVSRFPGHIACSPYSRSEIVVPVWQDNQVIAILDADSDQYSGFDDTDKYYLEILVKGLLPLE